MLSVFSFCVFCVLSGVFCLFVAVLLFLGSLGANFCFWVSVLVLCFLVGFGLCFCFTFWRLAPEIVRKNSLDVRSCFFGGVCSLFFGFLSSTPFLPFLFCFFSRDIAQVVTGHLLSWSFSLFVSRRTCCFALFGRASCFSAFSSGCHSGPRAFLGSPYGARARSPLPRPFSWDARWQGFSCASLVLVFFFPLLFCGYAFSRRPSR